MFRSAPVVAKPISPMGQSTIGSAVDQSAEQVDQQLKAKIISAGNDVRPMIHRPLSRMAALTAAMVGLIVLLTKSIFSLAFNVARVLGRFGLRAAMSGIGAIAVIGGGALAGYWLFKNYLPAGQDGADLQDSQASFGWARDQAEDAMRVAAYHARYRFRFGETDATLRATEERMHAMADIIGGDIEGLQASITQKFTDFRLQQGLRGDKDISAAGVLRRK